MSKACNLDEKVVQVGPKTWIVVKKNVSDDDAIKRYHYKASLNVGISPKRKVGRPKGGSKPELEKDDE
jgi:hypothetical protein